MLNCIIIYMDTCICIDMYVMIEHEYYKIVHKYN